LKLKILHLITTIELGGAEKQLLILSKQQRLMGHDVHIIPLKGKLDLLFEFSSAGCIVHTKLIGMNPLIQQGLLQRIEREVKPDILHAHLPRAELLLSLLVTKVPKIVSKHNTEKFFPKGNKYLSRLISHFVTFRTDRVVAISKAVKNYLIESNEIAESKKIEVVLYGMDQENNSNEKIKSQMILEFNASKESKIFGTIARLVPQKDLKTQLYAFSRYLEYNSHAILIVIGDGPMKSNLMDLSRQLGCDKNLIWYGRTRNIVEALQVFDVFLLSSLYEGLGLVLLEAIANEVPILAANNSAIPEVLGNNFPGLFPTSNCDELLTKMKLTDDPVFLHSLLTAQKKRREYFEPSAMAINIQSVYKGVLN